MPTALKILLNFHKYIHLFICFTPLITPAIQGKQQNTVVDGVKEGTVDLIAEGSGPHEWRKSTDEKEWTPLPASRTSKTTAKDLKSGELYSFQNRMMLTNDEKTEWSQSVKIRVR